MSKSIQIDYGPEEESEYGSGVKYEIRVDGILFGYYHVESKGYRKFWRVTFKAKYYPYVKKIMGYHTYALDMVTIHYYSEYNAKTVIETVMHNMGVDYENFNTSPLVEIPNDLPRRIGMKVSILYYHGRFVAHKDDNGYFYMTLSRDELNQLETFWNYGVVNQIGPTLQYVRIYDIHHVEQVCQVRFKKIDEEYYKNE